MITSAMQLNSKNDARVWADNMGLPDDESTDRIAQWIWDNKPHIGCTYATFKSANHAIMGSDHFWRIAAGEVTEKDAP